MIDAANPDILPDGLINFDKKRKEFEVLAQVCVILIILNQNYFKSTKHVHLLYYQIKLLQGAANSYNIIEDTVFDQWFHSILVLDDREAFRISCQIEPSENIPSSCTNSIIGTGKKQKYNIILNLTNILKF